MYFFLYLLNIKVRFCVLCGNVYVHILFFYRFCRYCKYYAVYLHKKQKWQSLLSDITYIIIYIVDEYTESRIHNIKIAGLLLGAMGIYLDQKTLKFILDLMGNMIS